MTEQWPESMPIVEIDWIDSSGYSGWQSVDAAKENTVSSSRSCGYLFQETEQYVSIVQNTSSTGHVDMLMAIPRSAVKSIKVVQKARKR